MEIRKFEGGALVPFDRELLSSLPAALPEGEYVILPGLADVHVHLREPGFCYKETVASGTLAAARGGYGAVCAMPNLDPVPDSVEHLAVELAAIKSGAVIPVYSYGAITRGEQGKELADLEGMAEHVVAFSDDGRGVAEKSLMAEALERAKNLGKIIAAHCEFKEWADGNVRAESGLNRTKTGIFADAEWRMVERDLQLCRDKKASLHICHVSTKESVSLIRDAKRDGVDVTAETAPHYLTLTYKDMDGSGRYKMNPPLGGEADREALLAGICDGTIDMIATDHAPHSAEEKSRGLDSLFGIVGLETAFPVLYTDLVLGGVISLEKLVWLMSTSPKKRFGIETNNSVIMELSTEYAVDSRDFLSKGRSTPFDGKRVRGRCVMNYNAEGIIWKDERIAK